MTNLAGILTLAAAASLSAQTHAQFVKGNEAVHVMPNGTRVVQTPPLPSFTLARPCAADRPGCASGGWLMVETYDGMRECTEYYARPTTCRPSTFGTEKRPRLWIVKVKSQWLQCQRPDLGSRCISLSTLPLSVIQ